ncbi:hypothetical protein BKA81DRAFT_206772 [Phyllosticta paracitricarpa]
MALFRCDLSALLCSAQLSSADGTSLERESDANCRAPRRDTAAATSPSQSPKVETRPFVPIRFHNLPRPNF